MKIDVSILGAGNLGTALAYALHDAGLPVIEIVTRRPTNRLRHLVKQIKHTGAALVDFEEAALKSRVIWITTPDSAIAATAASIAKKTTLHRQIVLHSSGVLSSEVLEPARAAGASIASAHPMMSFPRPGAVSLQGVTWAVEGDGPAVKTAREIINRLAGTSLKLSAKTKPLYHTLGTLSSPILVSLLTAAESAGRSSGLRGQDVRTLMRPIIERTTANFFDRGPAASFSGPFERGDVDTISLHLQALRSLPTVSHLYRAAALHALATLPVKNRNAIRALLESQNLPASKPRRRASAKSVRN